MALKRTSLTEKMVLYFLALGIGSILITGLFSYFTARNALLERTYNHLTSVRITRTAQVESFLDERLRETKIFASSAWIKKLANDAEAGKYPGKPDQEITLGTTFPDQVYYSGFAITAGKGEILYKYDPKSEIKHHALDLSALNPMQPADSPVLYDFRLKSGSEATPLVVVCPIPETGNDAVNLVMIIRIEKIDELLLEISPDRGLGYSGETYLVGPDNLMRSQSRFIPGSIMRTSVNTVPVKNALAGESGTIMAKDYRGVKVLSSYGPIGMKGLKWILLAEIDYQEVASAVYPIRNNILLLSVFTGTAFFIISFMISRSITKPLKKLRDAAIELGEGKPVSQVIIESDDEIGALTEAFNRMAVNIHEKDMALKTERHNRLRSAIDGQDQERQRLSREMHDGIGQSMIAVRLRLGALENKLPEKINQDLTSIIGMTDNLIDEVRAISNALMPPALVQFGLMAAIRNLCNTLASNNGTETIFEGEIQEQLLTNKAKLYLFRILQEALNNVSKHSGATTVRILSRHESSRLIIVITDNGKGFDPASSCAPKGHGLNNIRERASLLRGQAIITSSPGSGTSITIDLPIWKQIT